MFSGIIEEIGKIRSIKSKNQVFAITISANKILADTKIGDSIAVDGVCLTVIKIAKQIFTVEAMLSTYKVTKLAKIRVGSLINLERALKFGDRVGGHLISGHVNYLGKLKKSVQKGNYLELYFRCEKECFTKLKLKGSIAINGVSLTIQNIYPLFFQVNIIPHTLNQTNLAKLKIGEIVNLEIF